MPTGTNFGRERERERGYSTVWEDRVGAAPRVCNKPRYPLVYTVQEQEPGLTKPSPATVFRSPGGEGTPTEHNAAAPGDGSGLPVTTQRQLLKLWDVFRVC